MDCIDISVGFGMARLWSWKMAEPKNFFKLSKIAMLKVWFLGFLEELWNSLQEAVGFFFLFRNACDILKIQYVLEDQCVGFGMARLWSWIMAEPKNFLQIIQNSYAESLISGISWGTLKLTTGGSWIFFSFKTNFDHNWAKLNHTIPNQHILGPFSGLLTHF